MKSPSSPQKHNEIPITPTKYLWNPYEIPPSNVWRRQVTASSSELAGSLRICGETSIYSRMIMVGGIPL